MTDQPVPDPDDTVDPDGWDVSGFMAQLESAVESLTDDDSADVTVLELPQSALNALLNRLGLPGVFPEDTEPDLTPWKTLVASQLEEAKSFLPSAPRMTVLSWLIGDFNLQQTKYKHAESTAEADRATEMMCVYLARIVAVACFINKKYKPDYSRTSLGHKKTVDALLLRTAQHRWDDMGDVAARRLFTLMTGVR